MCQDCFAYPIEELSDWDSAGSVSGREDLQICSYISSSILCRVQHKLHFDVVSCFLCEERAAGTDAPSDVELGSVVAIQLDSEDYACVT